MHIAGEVFRKIMLHYFKESAKQRTQLMTEKQRESVRYIYFCFRIAALLHDTGHFPFSHEFEKNKSAEDLLSNKEYLKDFWGDSDAFTKYTNTLKEGNHVTHEHYSIAVAYHILSDANVLEELPVSIDDVIMLMENSNYTPSEKFAQCTNEVVILLVGKQENMGSLSNQKAASLFRSFLQKLISGEVDIDKMDYLLRDSYFTGSKYGVYNLDHLISTFRIGFHPKSQWCGLAILEKGVCALEDFVFSRFQIYQNLWGHKSVVGFKFLLAGAINESLSDTEFKKTIANAMKSPDDFQLLTDHVFYERFRKISKTQKKSLCNMFLSRKKPIYLGTEKKANDTKIEERLAKLREENPSVESKDSDIRFSKIGNQDYDEIRILAQRNIGKTERKYELKEIKDTTNFFNIFGGYRITHFYCIE